MPSSSSSLKPARRNKTSLGRSIGRLQEQPARKPLGGDQNHAGGDVKWCHAHVHQPMGVEAHRLYWAWRAHVTRLRGLDGDFAGIQIADFTNHDDIRSCRKKDFNAAESVSPALSFTLTWFNARQN